MCRNLSPAVGPSCLTRTGGVTGETATLDPRARPPAAGPTGLPWITRKVYLFKLRGSKLDARRHLEAASQIWSQARIRFEVARLKEDYNDVMTRQLLGPGAGDAAKPVEQLVCRVDPDVATESVKNLRGEWDKAGAADPDAIAVFFLPNVFLTTNGAPSCVDPERGYNIVYIGVTTDVEGRTLAHELGHLLMGKDLPHFVFKSSLMHPDKGSGTEIDEVEGRAARGDPKAAFVLEQRKDDPRWR
jgi:hypothetical protein